MSDPDLEPTPETWTGAVAPIVRKFEVAAATGFNAVWNPIGAKATGALMKEMARLLDVEAPAAIEVRDKAIAELTEKNQRLIEVGLDAARHIARLEGEMADLKSRLRVLEESL